jgi:hypothetical protein
MKYKKELDFDLYDVTGRSYGFTSNNNEEIITELNRIQDKHNFKFRVMYKTVQQCVDIFQCYFVSKEEFTNYWLPKQLSELFNVESFDSNANYLISKTGNFFINWVYDVHRLHAVEEFVTPAHAHWRQRWDNKFHPGYGRLSLVAFDKGHMPMQVVLSDYSDCWERLPLLTDELIANPNLYYTGVRMRTFDQPYWEIRELDEGFGHRFELPGSIECKYVNGDFFINDNHMFTIDNDRVTISEYKGEIFKFEKMTMYKNLEEFRQGRTQRS